MNKKTAPNPCVIATLGMDTQGCQLLAMVFKGPAKGRYQFIDDIAQADIVIFDHDHWQAEQEWQTYRQQYPHKPTVVLSLMPKQLPNSSWVKKPVSVTALLACLNQLVTDLQTPANTHVTTTTAQTTTEATASRVRLATDVAVEVREDAFREFCGHTPDINPSNQAELHRLFYQPQKYFQGCLQQQLVEGKDQPDRYGILFESFSEPFLLLPDENKVLHGKGFSDSKLHTMVSLPMQCKKSRLRYFNAAEVKTFCAQHQLITVSADYLLWKMSLWTARGRLPQETNLEKNVILLHWPNFTRLVVTPYALQIAALWLEKPLSLLETVRLLDIPQRYVFSFYSASYALNLAFLERREGARALEAEKKPLPQAHTKRGLLKRLLAHITS